MLPSFALSDAIPSGTIEGAALGRKRLTAVNILFTETESGRELLA